MKKKLRIGILFGGRSGEHEISLLSAASVLQAIDRKKYEVVPIGISKTGHWLHSAEARQLLTDTGTSTAPLQLSASADSAALSTNLAANFAQPGALSQRLDVVFPVLHGTFGEDGTIQGLFELADIAYVGSGVLGSAAGMDKDVMKKLFAAANLPQVPYLALTRTTWQADPRRSTRLIERSLTYPLFVKPANAGSSVGISKVHTRAELPAAINLAASFDHKIVIEQGVGGPGAKPRELEVAVLGNDTPQASIVGEIIPNKEFYDYESKYADSPANPSIPIIPAAITPAQTKQIRTMAVAAFRACECSGLARVDFLMEPTRKGSKTQPRIYLNEINTMPGFTTISMYPKLWEATGLPYQQLIDRLIQLALERHKEKQQTRFTRT